MTTIRVGSIYSHPDPEYHKYNTERINKKSCELYFSIWQLAKIKKKSLWHSKKKIISPHKWYNLLDIVWTQEISFLKSPGHELL